MRRGARFVSIILIALAAATTPAGASGLPPGMPPAATADEPTLPRPSVWPFVEGFPHTSGTGLYSGGARFWTDFLYDDNGAVGADPPAGESAGAVTFGTYAYPDANEAGNGADIFRTAVGLTATDTWWRVDWNTLIDKRVPIAAFGIDADGAGGAPVAWPANVGVRTAGLDRVLVVSGTSARLLDAAGTLLGTGELTVDTDARSFVVRLPRSLFNPSGTSTLHLAAGLADAAGTGFLALGAAHRHLPGQANVYNMAFRDMTDEPASNNFWFDTTQATTLTPPSPDVSAFAMPVAWARLAAGDSESEPVVTGWSNRWYVSTRELGQGRVASPQSTADNEPNYLGRVQPYGVYVPTRYEHALSPAPLTWLLHSFTINHNQYGATMPKLLKLACEDRSSICATTLGRGPDGQYVDAAELDFWEVWKSLNQSFRLDPDRTIISGYSMGGFGTARFAPNHPDLFAGMVLMSSAAEADLPRFENLRWTPYYHSHGVLDQLVPYVTEAKPTVDELDRLGYRYRFDTYPTKDHIAWSLEDGLYLAAQWMAEQDRVRPGDPGHITYRWFPADVHTADGYGPTGAWWLRNLIACDATKPEARADAISAGIPDAAVTPERSSSQFVDDNGNAVARSELTWKLGTRPAAQPRIALTLSNVGYAGLDLARAGVQPKGDARIDVDTSCALKLTLPTLAADTPVFVDLVQVGGLGAGAASSIEPTFAVPAGTHVITFSRAAAEAAARGGLPATGGGAPLGMLGVALLAVGLGVRLRITRRVATG